METKAEKAGTVRLRHVCMCALTILCDDDICMRAAVLVDVVDGLLDAVHHFNAQFQVPILRSEGLYFRGAEGQVGGELGACVNFHLEQRKSRGENINTAAGSQLALLPLGPNSRMSLKARSLWLLGQTVKPTLSHF